MIAALIVGTGAALESARVHRVVVHLLLLLLIFAARLIVLSSLLRTISGRQVIQTYGSIIDVVAEHCGSGSRIFELFKCRSSESLRKSRISEL